jgi:hypothetical protein
MRIISQQPLPDTHWPYYSKRLECWWLIDVDGWKVPTLWVEHWHPPLLEPEAIPTWRLTPQVCVWCYRAGEN